MNAADLLANTLSADTATREDATAKLEAASRENYGAYMLMMSEVLVNEQGIQHVRTAAGLALKNGLTARETTRQNDFSQRWLGLPSDARGKIKNDALGALASPAHKTGNVAAQVVAAIAAVELPVAQWDNLIQILLDFVNNNANNTALKIATLQAIGYICESIKPDTLARRSNEILTAVIHGARKEEPSPEVQSAAIHALFNSLEFVRDNFERDGERNYIMQVVCEATQNQNVQVQVGAFECLVRIMSLYYDKMALYMEQALFGLTVVGMKHDDERVSLQAVEFWSTVCEEEIELDFEAQEAQEYGEMPEQESRHFAKIALPEIVPVLLMLLTKQDEDAEEDEWNISMAAGTCLGLLSQAVHDAIVPAVIPFIEAHIKTQDWHQREAAVMTFGSILEGPDPIILTPLVEQALPLLIDMMTDANPHVKDTTAWTLGRICEIMISAIKPDVHLHGLVSALVNGLTDVPRIVANCCWALMNLAEQVGMYLEDPEAAENGPLSPYYAGVIESLLKVTEAGNNEGSFRTPAYEAIINWITYSTKDAVPIVQKTLITILGRMEHLLSIHNQIVGQDDRQNWNDLQCSLCSVLIAIVRKLGPTIQPVADRMMTVILSLLQSSPKTSTIQEDAFLVVGALCGTLETAFAPYLSAFLPYLYPALKAYDDTTLCTVAIGIIGDVVRALGEQAAQYAEAFMTVLLENLRSEVLERGVKIVILGCFGDVALAVGGGFEPYLNTSMEVLGQAASVQANPLDYDTMEYVLQLREGILEAYTGIVAGLKGTPKVDLLLPHVPQLLQLIQVVLSDEEKTDSQSKLAYGLLWDIADTFKGGQIRGLLLQEWIVSEMRPRGARLLPETKKVWKHAREAVKIATAVPQ